MKKSSLICRTKQHHHRDKLTSKPGFEPGLRARTRASSGQGPVSRKSRHFSGLFRVTEFNLYLQNEGVSRHETLQLFLFLFPLQHMKRPGLQNTQVVILRMAFRARKVIGTFEKRAPGLRARTPVGTFLRYCVGLSLPR